MKTSLEAYAKINLYLDIVGKRENGYHDIKGIMHKISLSDNVSVEISECDENQITLTCSSPDIPCDNRNIAYKAALMYLDSYTDRTYKVSIHIEKHIPAAGGLAGGSTDGAAVLKAMHTLLGGVDHDTLIRDSARLGADLPFCMVDCAMITEGIGERLTPCPSLSDCVILICNTGESVSTPLAYAQLDAHYDNFLRTEFDEVRFASLRDGLESGDLSVVARNMYNVFESVVLESCPQAKKVKEIVLAQDAIGAMMSGSGSTIFAIYKDEQASEKAYKTLCSLGYTTHICKNIF